MWQAETDGIACPALGMARTLLVPSARRVRVNRPRTRSAGSWNPAGGKDGASEPP